MFEIIPFTHGSRSRSVYDPFDIFTEFEKNFWSDTRSTGVIRTDIRDLGNSYEIKADLPGFNKEDIKIDLDNDVLTLTATRHSEAEQKDGKNSYVRVERSYGVYSRSFDVSGTDTDNIEAAYENGVLTLTLPKLTEKVSSARSIDIK